MIRHVAATIRMRRLLERGETVLVAVSGGADSVSLLLAMAWLAPRMGFAVAAAHLDHRIRGAESAADARFVRRLCDRLGLRCILGRADVPGLAARRRWSLEQAARSARYAFLARSAHKLGACAVAVAHTADDQAETVLLRLLRGAGQGGLAGMAHIAQIAGVTVIRPLLDIRRSAARAFLERGGHEWREDESNTDTAMLRNRVRHELLPLLRTRFGKGVERMLLRMSDIVRAEDELLTELADAAARGCIVGRRGCELEMSVFRALPRALRRRVLRIWLTRAGVTPEQMEFDVIDGLDRDMMQIGKCVARDVIGGFGVRLGSGPARLARKRAGCKTAPASAVESFRRRIAVPGITMIEEAGIKVTARLSRGIARDRTDFPGALPAVASLNHAVWRGRAMYLRSRRPGDRIKPLGGSGARKLQDILVDAKIAVELRAAVPVLECGGDIAWVPGYRIARDWALGSDKDKAVLIRIEQMRG